MRARLRRFWLVPAAVGLAMLTASCFTLQGFVLLSGAVAQGGKTTARFQLRPRNVSDERDFQFVLVGVPDSGHIIVGKSLWGTNNNFAGPFTMSVEGNLADVLADDGGCATNGLAFNSITGVTWKGFMTPNGVRTRGDVNEKVHVDVALRSAADAPVNNYGIFGVTGVWDDDGDDVIDTGDTFDCTGIASVGLYVASAG